MPKRYPFIDDSSGLLSRSQFERLPNQARNELPGDPVEEIEAGHTLTWKGEDWAVTTAPEVGDQDVTFWAGRLADVVDPETGAWHDDPLVDKFSFPRGTKLNFG